MYSPAPPPSQLAVGGCGTSNSALWDTFLVADGKFGYLLFFYYLFLLPLQYKRSLINDFMVHATTWVLQNSCVDMISHSVRHLVQIWGAEFLSWSPTLRSKYSS